jgi:hypothetical protein
MMEFEELVPIKMMLCIRTWICTWELGGGDIDLLMILLGRLRVACLGVTGTGTSWWQ